MYIYIYLYVSSSHLLHFLLCCSGVANAQHQRSSVKAQAYNTASLVQIILADCQLQRYFKSYLQTFTHLPPNDNRLLQVILEKHRYCIKGF